MRGPAPIPTGTPMMLNPGFTGSDGELTQLAEVATDEIQTLRRCTRDIIAISTLPAIWASQAPAQVAGSLAEVLTDTLRLEFAYIRLNAPDRSLSQVCYTPQGFLTEERLRVVSRFLDPRLRSEQRISLPRDLLNPFGPGTLQLAVVSLGLAQRWGVLVVASERAAFPVETERLVLNVASNQAAIVLERRWTELALEKSQQQRAELYTREERRSRQLHQLAQASLTINSAPSLEQTLTLITEWAQKIIGCHQAVAHMQTDVERAGEAPPRGCLTVPLVGRNGKNIGMIQLSDRLEGPFSDDDKVILTQLAQMAAIALENVRLYEEAKQERDLAERARTKLRLVSDTLKESAARLDLAVRTAHLGIFDWDIVSDIHIWSDEASRYFGYEPGKSPGSLQNFLDRVHPEDRARVFDSLQTTLKDCSEIFLEYRSRWPDGTVRWLSARGQVFVDAAGKPIRILGTLLDISEQKRVEEALRAAIQTRDEFLSIASHELKTPIAALKMHLQMTQRRVSAEKGLSVPPEKLARMLTISTRQVDRLTSLVEDLLDVSRIQSGKLDFRFEEVDVSTLIHEVVERLRDQLTGAGCSVEVAAEPLSVECDRFRMEQVLVNLLTNAMKYGASKPVHIAMGLLNGTATVTVRDFGIGIEREEHDRIFERFARAVPSRNISGLGLGLYIVKQILIAHHGNVRVESEPGKGSTFIVELPIKQPLPAV